MSAILILLVFCALDGAHGQQNTCPTSEQRDLAQQVVTASFNDFVLTADNEISNHPCGTGNWTRVAYLNMNDPAQQCPQPWVEFNVVQAGRTCSRLESSEGNCLSVNYLTNGVEYNRVCGRSIGYQEGTPDAFLSASLTIDDIYVNGLSVTHGSPRQHIWTFAAGITEAPNENGCFCGNPNSTAGRPPPAFVGNNYFCESGNPEGIIMGVIFFDDPLWDGMNCPSNNCCEFNNPPWFNVDLPTSTTDDIEVRLCLDQSTNDENLHVQLIEVYVS